MKGTYYIYVQSYLYNEPVLPLLSKNTISHPLDRLMELFYNPSAWKGIFMSVLLSLTLFSYSQAQQLVNNTRPTLDRIPDYSTRFSTDLHFIELNGITAGDEIDQEVSIEVSTEDNDLIETIGADIVDNGKAFISYRLKEGAAGTATVTVIVTDNGLTPASITRIFRITSEALNRELAEKTLSTESGNNHLKAFPNPALLSTRVYFSTPHDEQRVALDLYTLSGAKIKQLFTGKTRAHESYYVDINSKNLATGVYIVRLIGQSHTANLKLVLAR